MTKQQKYELGNWVIQEALNYGAQQAVAIISTSKSNHIEVREQKIDKLEQSIQCSLTLRLYVDGRYSAHSTNRLKKAELSRFLAKAIEGTRYLTPDTFRVLPDPDLYFNGESRDLKMYDPAFENITVDEKIALAMATEQEVLGKDDRLISVTSSYYDGVYEKVMLTSNGFSGQQSHTYFGISSAVSVNGGNSRPESHWNESAMFYNQVQKHGTGEKALQRALQKIGQKKSNSAKMQMLVENRQVNKLLAPLLSALKGASIQQKNSFLLDKTRQKVVSEKLTLVDDPWLIGGRASKMFDGEGLATQKRMVFDKGVLQSYFLDSYYANKLHMHPTSGSTTNLVFEVGQNSPDELLSTLKNGILVTGFNGGNCNGSTGDFSYGIEGFLVENGQRIQPVSEMNITGNMLDLWGNLEALANDVNEASSIRAPSILFNNVDISGL